MYIIITVYICYTHIYIYNYLEPKWPLFWLEFRPCFGGFTFKHRGHLGSRYRTLSNELDPVASSIFSQPCLAGLQQKLVDQKSQMLILLMVQKSGDHQLRLVVHPIIYSFFLHPRWLFGISEPSTVSLDRCDPSPVSIHGCGWLQTHFRFIVVRGFTQPFKEPWNKTVSFYLNIRHT